MSTVRSPASPRRAAAHPPPYPARLLSDPFPRSERHVPGSRRVIGADRIALWMRLGVKRAVFGMFHTGAGGRDGLYRAALWPDAVNRPVVGTAIFDSGHLQAGPPNPEREVAALDLYFQLERGAAPGSPPTVA